MIQPKGEDCKEIFNVEIEMKKRRMNASCPEAYQDLKKRMQVIKEFIKTEKRGIANKELYKKFYDKISIFIEPLK